MFKDEWVNKVDGVDYIIVDDVNLLAEGIINNEQSIEELSIAPREVIYLTNGKRIESREDGIYMVGIDGDGENFETVLCDAYGWIPEAQYANEAYFAVDADSASYANEASSDENGNVIHETYATKEEVGDISAVLEELHTYAQNLISGGETV